MNERTECQLQTITIPGDIVVFDTIAFDLSEMIDSLESLNAPVPTCEPEYEPTRKRAQWKDETRLRGRNR